MYMKKGREHQNNFVGEYFFHKSRKVTVWVMGATALG